MTPEPAQIALTQRRFADAARLLDEWLAANPDDADAWFNLGYARRQLLEPHAALAAYERALACGIDQPEATHLNIAAIHTEVLHGVTAARAHLNQALATNPGLAIAWANLGQLEEDVGDAAAARAAYEAAAQVQPSFGRAHARLAAIDVFEGKPDVALARLAAADPLARDIDDLVELDFAAANTLDALGRYDEAFDRADNGNMLQRRSSPYRYDRAGQAAQIAALIDMFPAEPLPPPMPGAARPLLITGLFRSGSTLLETLLARRAGIPMGGELAYTPWFVAEHGAELSPATLGSIVSRYRDGYLAFVRDVLGDVPLFTDKRVDNFLYLGLIKRAFPDALIVETVRNPIDNFLSMFFLPFANNLLYANDLDDMLDFYRQYRRIMAHWQACFGADIVQVRYETLVRDPDAALAPVLARLGDTAGSSPGPDVIRTASAWAVRQPLHGRSAGRWRNYERNIGDLAEALRAEFPDVSE